jgi:hypothetical protein
MIQLLHSFFLKIEQKENFLTYSVSLALSWYQNEINVLQERKVINNISYEHRCKNVQQNASKLNSTLPKKNYIPWSMEFITGIQGWFMV